MPSDSETTLLERYSPVVQYDSQESFAADSAATMTDCVPAGSPQGNLLRDDDGATLAVAKSGPGETNLTLDFLRRGHYPDAARTAVSPDDYLDAVGKHYVVDARAMHTRPGYADQVYGYAVKDKRGALWLQYWFFYYYNNKAFLYMGLHEGDWEMVQFRLGADGEPDVATYAQHSGGERCTWSDVEHDTGPDGPLPVVYSARGSHASYFRRGTYPEAPIVPDHNDAGGPRVRPELTVIGDDGPAWVAWPGRWGSTRATVGPIGSNSPPGPREHGAWRDPLAFHNKAEEVRELGPVAGVELQLPPVPEIAVRRSGDRAYVSYRFPAVPAGAPGPAKLVLSLDGHKDGRPPATKSWPVSAEPGEIEFPLDLEDRDYTVRASAADEDGLTGPATTAPLPTAASKG
jgi:Vacuolar protein sorting-associated protein 62